MLLGYPQKHMDRTYPLLNIETKCSALSHGIIFLDKTYSRYAPRKDTTKATNYILQDEDESDKWSSIKIYYVRTEVNIEDVKYEQKIKTTQDSKGLEDAQKTINILLFYKTRKSS